MKEKFGKKGNILVENVIFIVLNLAFISILMLFVFSRASASSISEEVLAKKIALMIDSSKPGMQIVLDMKDDFKKLDKENFPRNEVVSIEGNVVTVKLKPGKGYSYSFFNDVDVNYFDVSEGYVFTINDYKTGGSNSNA